MRFPRRTWRDELLALSGGRKNGSGHRRAGLAASGVTFIGQDVAIMVAMVNRDPSVRYRTVDTALEVAVANVEEMDSPERPAGLHFVANEDAEDLSAGFFFGERVSHEYTGSN